ncbi:MAG: hypothetical protein E7290_10525 [Lachnospiraceae bacterium]|nr:hypothetical protein [Lachnospiraceae bacterium]
MCRGIEKLKVGLLLVAGVLTLIGCGAEDSTPDVENEVASQVSCETIEESSEHIVVEKSSASAIVNEIIDTETEMAAGTEVELEDGTVALSDEIGIISGSVDAPEASVQGTSALAIPAYIGESFVVLNNNIPLFAETELTTTSFEYYSPLDALGRCGVTYACIGTDIMPTEERGNIGQIKPTGWHTIKYEGIDGNYLYNRCHLIGYQLTGENANEQNLITGTRSMNVDGMLPFENMVADYVKETGNHVLYRVTPIFEGDNLLATGVQMEAMSVEDKGAGILFHAFVYNVQPGIVINYADGSSSVGEVVVTTPVVEQPEAAVGTDYILNTNTHKFHYPDCRSVNQMKAKNRKEYTGTREELIAQGYDPCGNCHP